jgi:uncharacterized membrane protein YhhN
MKTREIALRLYILSSFLAVLATITDNDLLILFAKPTVIPAIYYYYLTSKTRKINWLFVTVLLLNFIGDTIVLLEIPDQTLIIMVPYFFSYLILLSFVIEDVKQLRFNKYGVILCFSVFVFLMYVMYLLLQLFSATNPELVIPVIIYGIVLATYACIALYCYYKRVVPYTFYLLMFALTSIVSDVFYIMFNFIYRIPFLNYVEFAVQLISYYFVVKYFVLRRVTAQ